MASQITIGGGRFWCIDAVFRHLWGVSNVVCGYSGSSPCHTPSKEACIGLIGDAEVIQIDYDLQVIETKKLLDVFFTLHDPTEYHKQDDDVGSQYRSVIYYHNDDQKHAAQSLIADLVKNKAYGNRLIFTEVAKFDNFVPAEEYQQNFYKKNPQHDYCKNVIKPKLAKFKQTFRDFYVK